jgi:3-hydroxyisobutyrate dehydrogenase-like beta-hydroxyacid dehydrogenase
VVNDAGGMAATPLFRERFPRMLADAPVDARLAIGAKDADLFHDLIEPGALSLADATARIFSAAKDAGLADEDVTSVWRVFERADPSP